jgi:hypothetical protein
MKKLHQGFPGTPERLPVFFLRSLGNPSEAPGRFLGKLGYHSGHKEVGRRKYIYLANSQPSVDAAIFMRLQMDCSAITPAIPLRFKQQSCSDHASAIVL